MVSLTVVKANDKNFVGTGAKHSYSIVAPGNWKLKGFSYRIEFAVGDTHPPDEILYIFYFFLVATERLPGGLDRVCKHIQSRRLLW